MHKRTWLGAIALGAILTAGGLLQFRPSSGDHVYTVAQVAAGLTQRPRSWVGRTIAMQGVVVMVEWANGGGDVEAYCPTPQPCSMLVPRRTVLDLFLLGQPLHGGPAANSLLMTLQGVQGGPEEEGAGFPVLSTTPPSIVVKV